MRYYLLSSDKHHSGRWHLGTIDHCNNWQFLTPEPVDLEPGRYRLNIKAQTGPSLGTPMDFTQTLLYGLPILSDKASHALRDLPDLHGCEAPVVLQPLDLALPAGVDVDDPDQLKGFSLMVTETLIDCVDETRSCFQIFEENDPVRPDKAGDYTAFANLVIDPDQCAGHNIFRLSKYATALIVSEEVKQRFDAAGVRGAVFESVNGDQQTVA